MLPSKSFSRLLVGVVCLVWSAGAVHAQKPEAYYPGECQDASGLSDQEKNLVKFVCEAKAFTLEKIKQLGPEAGLAAAYEAFSKQDDASDCKAGQCPFQRGELYMFAYENVMKNGKVTNIMCRAHGASPDMIGRDFYNTGFVLEAFPKYGITKKKNAKFVRMVSDAAFRKKGYAQGFVLFTWPNPTDGNNIWLKKSYSTKISDTVWIGSGIYIEKK